MIDLDATLAQLPDALRSEAVLRGDTGSGLKELSWHVHNLGLQYSVGVYGSQPAGRRAGRRKVLGGK